MARTINRLNDRKIKLLKEEGVYPDGGNLYLRITATKDGTGINKYWIFRFASRATGRDKQYGIGPLHDIGLAAAREKAHHLRLMLREGRDPLDEKRAQEAAGAVLAAKGTMTFDKAAEKYIAAHEASWSSEMHRRQWVDTLARYASPIIGDLDVAAIDTTKVLEVLEQPVGKDGPLWTARTETASRLRSRIELILDWAKVRGHRQGENPAKWRGHLAGSLAKPSRVKNLVHHAALDHAAMAAFLVELRNKQTMGARALEFLILTATRTAEARLAEWKEFDLDAKVWTIPKERMKLRKEHRVPLSPAAIALLEQMKAIRHGDFVFPSTHGAIARIDRELMDLRPGVTVHGMRAAFKTWASERTSFPPHIVEMCLAHQVGNAVERAYQRSDLEVKRRQLMNAWGEYCNKPAVTTGTVTPIRKIAGDAS